MKNLVFIFTILLVACGAETEAPATDTGSIPAPLTEPAPLASPSVSIGGIFEPLAHFKCPDGCQGGFGDAVGNCPTCGKEMVHNQAFHDQQNTDPQSISPQQTEAPQNAAGVWHFTCPNGCSGGGSSATACATCGTLLAHNQAYHPTDPAANTETFAPEPTAEPAQNAAGIWHYTCPSGCAGGGGSATACATCGSTLAHNQAYHDQ